MMTRCQGGTEPTLGVCTVTSAEQGAICNFPGELLRRIPTATGHRAGAALASLRYMASSEDRREGGSIWNASAAAPHSASHIVRSTLHHTNM